LTSSSRAWASCALMSAPLASEVGAHLAPSPRVVQFSGSGGLLRRQPPPRSRRSPGRRRPQRSTHARSRSFRCWSRRSTEPVVCGMRNRWNTTGSDTPEKSHSAYPCEVAGGSSLAEPW
jgi:hypothetical protein